MKLFSYILAALLFSITITSCGNEEETPTNNENLTQQAGESDKYAEEYEQYIAEIDNNDSLNTANSLYYTRQDGASFEVLLLLNDSSEIVRMQEQYTTSGSGSIQSKWFYYKDGSKYATKEYFEKGTGDQAFFTERVTYYDEKEKPLVSKERTAAFEDQLDQESFKVVDAIDCSASRALAALNQEGEFATYFKGFVSEGPLSYLIVGNDKEDGYVSSLLVQFYTPLVNSLIKNEQQMLGTKLQVQFETVQENTGYTFQALMGVAKAE